MHRRAAVVPVVEQVGPEFGIRHRDLDDEVVASARPVPVAVCAGERDFKRAAREPARCGLRRGGSYQDQGDRGARADVSQ